MIADYKDLIAWQKAVDLSVEIYRVSNRFPAEERFGLTNQVRRAGVSIASNIAEGQGRGSDRDFLRFLYIANGSRQEAETQLIVAERLGFIPPDDFRSLLERTAELGRILSGLIGTVRATVEDQPA